MMQQQFNQKEQCGNQQQLQQPVMLCPVQYVYDTPMLMPQTQEDQIQQNQILINVKNPPPWIQNRPQNQVVYVQQLPNNYQPYIHQQMIQNPIYHPQMSYQIQPMLTQDNRQFVQIPNLNQFHMVQNQIAHIQQQNNEDTDKMPLLTQMLSQKVVTSRPTNPNNVRPTANVTAIANVAPNANVIRPVMQNQQVQTDISTAKGRPRQVHPQIITINPMQQRPFLANQKQEVQMNVRPTANIVRADVPQHIRTKIPSSISVKTINRPILPRPLIRPFDVMPAPQNFYYNPIIMTAPNTETINKNIVTNTETVYLRPNIQEVNPRTSLPMQFSVPTSNMPPTVKMETKNVNETENKQIGSGHNMYSSNVTKMTSDSNKITGTESSIGINTESQTHTEEKLIRNTVYVQARGRILNEKDFVHNQSLKRTIDDRLTEGIVNPETNKDVTAIDNTDHSSKKYIKIEPTENSLQTEKVSVNSPVAKTPPSIQTQQSRITNLQICTNNLKSSIDSSANNNNGNTSSNLNVHKAQETDKAKRIENIKEKSIENNNDSIPIKRKSSTEVVKQKVDDKKGVEKLIDKKSNKSGSKEETALEKVKIKEEKITVLTHVLEGYIIQESNVAFPIQKPTIEKEIKKEKDNIKDQDKVQNKSNTREQNKSIKKENVNTENKGHYPKRYLNSSIESEKEMEFAVIDKVDPFINIKKCTVETWTADQLSSHLDKHGWTETASRLLDEEIDGESILLVNKEQLVAVGVNETHADVIVAFAAS